MNKRVAILFRNETPESETEIDDTRFAAIAAALRKAGLQVESAPFADETADAVQSQLMHVDGVLVWVNPIDRGRNRSVLDAMLRNVARNGILVSAHPDVIDAMGTKEVLYRTRRMEWGSDVRHYRSFAEFAKLFPASLVSGQPRVLKPNKGNGGSGVWKVEPVGPVAGDNAALRDDELLSIRQATRGSREEERSLGEFILQCQPFFAGGGRVVDQAWQPRLAEGMVRCYLAGGQVAGFGEQHVVALHPDTYEPGPRLYYPPDRPDFQRLRRRVEDTWVPELCRVLELGSDQLPVIWDAGFLYGPRDSSGEDTYVLCEINVSSVYPIPDASLEPKIKTLRLRPPPPHRALRAPRTRAHSRNSSPAIGRAARSALRARAHAHRPDR